MKRTRRKASLLPSLLARPWKHELAWILALSGGIGFLYGAWVAPSWQAAVEAGQYVAGIVKYPDQASGPFVIYQNKLWTLANQLSALLLLAGLHVTQASIAVSGLLSAMGCMALAGIVFAISRARWLAITTALFFAIKSHAVGGINYPAFVAYSPTTYGCVGLGITLLTLAAIGTEHWKAAALILALAPGAHPSMGPWVWIVVFAVLVWEWYFSAPAQRRELVRELRACARYFVAGLLVLVVSLVAHWAQLKDFSVEKAPELVDRLIPFYIKNWDYHRNPVNFRPEAIRLCLWSGALSAVALWAFRERLTRGPRLILRAVTLYSAIALFATWVAYTVPLESVPQPWIAAMPMRLSVVSNVAFMAIPAALLALMAESWVMQLALVLYLVKLDGQVYNAFDIPIWAGAAACALAIARRWVIKRKPRTAPEAPGLLARSVQAIAVGIVAFSLFGRFEGFGTFRNLEHGLPDYHQTPLAQGSGYLLPAPDLRFMQYSTGRPMLIETAPDFIPFLPESIPIAYRLLKDVYGVDLLNPPPGTPPWGAIPSQPVQPVWEQRPPAEWGRIRAEYGVTEVVTRAHWQLQLPVAAEVLGMKLYRIP